MALFPCFSWSFFREKTPMFKIRRDADFEHSFPHYPGNKPGFRVCVNTGFLFIISGLPHNKTQRSLK